MRHLCICLAMLACTEPTLEPPLFLSDRVFDPEPSTYIVHPQAGWTHVGPNSAVRNGNEIWYLESKGWETFATTSQVREIAGSYWYTRTFIATETSIISVAVWSDGSIRDGAVTDEYPADLERMHWGGQFPMAALLHGKPWNTRWFRDIPAIAFGKSSFSECIIDMDGDLQCDSEWNRKISVEPGPFTELSMSTFNVCAIRANGDLFCTDSVTDDSPRWDNWVPPPGAWRHVITDNNIVCALSTIDDGLSCWGTAGADRPLDPYAGLRGFDVFSPVDDPRTARFKTVSIRRTGGFCGITKGEAFLVCWGGARW
jgi:hypothetical protein